MSALFFYDKRGKFRLVNANVTKENVCSEIETFVKKINPNFHICYIRSWAASNGTEYDIGSHNEFFITKDKCCANCKHYLGGEDFGLCCDINYGLWYNKDCCNDWEENK